MASDDSELARELAQQAGRLLLELRATRGGGEPKELGKAGDRLSQDFLAAELAQRRPGDAVLSEEAVDDKGRLSADRVWIIDQGVRRGSR
jgi:3'(2'), 5'-bisphosphate nucleotidase